MRVHGGAWGCMRVPYRSLHGGTCMRVHGGPGVHGMHRTQGGDRCACAPAAPPPSSPELPAPAAYVRQCRLHGNNNWIEMVLFQSKSDLRDEAHRVDPVCVI